MTGVAEGQRVALKTRSLKRYLITVCGFIVAGSLCVYGAWLAKAPPFNADPRPVQGMRVEKAPDKSGKPAKLTDVFYTEDRDIHLVVRLKGPPASITARWYRDGNLIGTATSPPQSSLDYRFDLPKGDAGNGEDGYVEGDYRVDVAFSPDGRSLRERYFVIRHR